MHQNGLIEVARNLCLSLPLLDDKKASEILEGVKGRGGFGPLLTQWLEQSRAVFPEAVRVEYPEAMSDRGLDIWVEGLSSSASFGFQLKSKHDLAAEDFFAKLKAQITDARAYPGLELYIVVLAVEPHHKNFMKIQHTFNEALNQWRGPKPEILVLQPGRAAALFQLCQNAPLKAEDRPHLLQTRTWGQFFEAVNQAGREAEFLGRWPDIQPQERFVTPNDWDEVVQSVQENHLTILTGPPAVGKTFGAVQLLFQHFQEGKPVRWIGASSGLPEVGLPPVEATPGLTEHLRILSRTLGVEPPREPVDALEFVAAHLKPDTLVLIEDPFGQTDPDFSRSLHTLRFFDLGLFVRSLAEGGRRSSARLLLTSRQGLFERWRDMKGELPSHRLISLTADSYQFLGTDWKKQPKVVLARQLVENQIQHEGLELQGASEDNIALVLGSRCESPREIELVIKELPTSVTVETVEERVNGVRGGVLERTQRYCQTANDAERLFLVGLVCFKGYRFAPHFTLAYQWLYSIFETSSEGLEEENRCRARFRPAFNALPVYHRIFHKAAPSPPKDEVLDAGEDFLEELIADEVVYESANTFIQRMKRTEKVLIEGRDILEPSHSTVRDATREELHKHSDFLSRLVIQMAAYVPVSGVKDEEKFNPAEAQRRVLQFLLGFTGSISAEADMALSAWLRAELKRLCNGEVYRTFDQRTHLRGLLLTAWPELSDAMRQAVLRDVEAGEIPAEDICDGLVYHEDFPREDAWRLYRALWIRILRDNIIPVGGILSVRANPFRFLLAHLEEAPRDLTFFFDWLADGKERVISLKAAELLEEQTATGESNFPFGAKQLSELVNHEHDGQSALLLAWLILDISPDFWDKFTPNWRKALTESPVKDDLDLQKRLGFTLLHALLEDTVPQELLQVSRNNLRHPNPKMRAQTGMFTLIHWSLRGPEDRDGLRELFRSERDLDVVFEILFEAAQPTKSFIELSRILLSRLNISDAVRLMKATFKAMAAQRDDEFNEMMGRDMAADQEFWDFLRDCLPQTGEWGRVALWREFGDKPQSIFCTKFGFAPVTDWENESEAMRLAFFYRCLKKWRSGRKHHRDGGEAKLPHGATPEGIAFLQNLVTSISYGYQKWAFALIGYESSGWPDELQVLAFYALKNEQVALREWAESGRELRRKDEEENVISSLKFPLPCDVE